MSQGLKVRHALIVSCVGLILTFQNCSQANFDAEAEAQSFEDAMPFAYSAKIDTIAYMSCSGMSDNPPEKRGYFTFRAGAYGTCNPTDSACQQNPFQSPIAGLAMSKEFRDSTKYYDKKQKAHLFSQSAKNSNTYLSLSIRSSTNYQQPWKEGNLVAGEELDAMLPALDTAPVAGPLGYSSEGQMLNYFPGSQTQRLMEGSLRFYNFENTAKMTRDYLNNRESLLVMGYSGSADLMDTALRSPAQNPTNQAQLPANRAYGTGYYVSFSLPYGYSAGEQRVISSGTGIGEIELLTGQPNNSASWDCNANYQFMIVRPEDVAAGRVTCATTVDRYANANEQAALNAVRRVLRVEDWFVDVSRKCLVPKRTGDYCYGAVQGRTIQYGVASCLNGATTMCPHFVSVCVRR